MNLLKVLIVDDEYLIRKLITMRIDWEANGMIVVGEASSSDEAFQMVENLKPDIIFTDICMPKMDGIDFATKVVAKYPEIRIAVITGHSDFNYAQRCIRAGIVDYLLKPIMENELLSATKRMKESIEKERRLMRSICDNPDVEIQFHPLVRRVLAYISEHLHDANLNVNDVSTEFFVSRSHLGRLLKRDTGKTFVELITEMRMKEAKFLAASTDMAAYEIGKKIGIHDPHYFSILFKKWVGISLKQYRKSLRN